MNEIPRIRRYLFSLLLTGAGLMAASSARAWPSLGGPGLPVCDAPGSPNLPAGAPDGHGGVFLAWTDWRAGYPELRLFAQHIDATGTPLWTEDGIPLNTSKILDAPRLAFDGADGVIVVWRDFRADTAGNVYAQHLSGAGAKLWSSSDVAVAAGPLHETALSVSPDGAGGAFVSWSDDRTGTSDIRVQRITGAGDLAWGPDGVAMGIVTLGNYPLFSKICADHADGALVGFTAFASGSFNAYVQRLSAAGVPQWTAGGVRASTSTLGVSCADLAADGTGGAVIALRDNHLQNSFQQAFAQRIAADGTVAWAADGVPLSGSVNPVEEQNVAGDGTGGGIFEWCDYLNDGSGNSRLYVQHVDAAGAPTWGPGTQVLASAVDGGSGWLHSQMVADGAGGVVVGWNAQGGSGGFDISAQRVAAGGSRVWPVPRVLASLTNIAWQMGLVPDGTGGVVASWLNFQNAPASYTLAAERVTGNGTLDVRNSVTPIGSLRCVPSPARVGEAITLRFRMTTPGEATVRILDVSGRLVRSLFLDIGFGPGGLHPPFFEQRLVWDGLDSQGRQVPPAVYVVRVQATGSGEASGHAVVVQ